MTASQRPPTTPTTQTLTQLARALEAGETTSVELVEQALAAIVAPDGQGGRTFVLVDAEAARAQARTADQRRARGGAPSPFCGIPVSTKDLFDVRGQATRAGSRALRGSPPAERDATAVARLRGAGLVLIGRTNMTEFAYSGLGLNPHYGTPLNPFERARGRIPGGSSSGAAVSVTDGMAAVGIGTDTGGSCRIPAAMCGIVGYKPTAASVPRNGVLPLSESLDSVGPLGRSVECCAIAHRTMSGRGANAGIEHRPLSNLVLGVPRHHVLADLDAEVEAAFERAVRRLRAGGATVRDIPFAALDRLPEINAGGGLAGAEAYAWHRRMLAEHEALYDPRVRARLLKGAEQSAADYIDVLRARAELIAQAQATMRDLDALIHPTVPMIAPLLAELQNDDEYAKANMLALRNTSVANFLDACAISVPIHEPGSAPVGLNALRLHGGDEQLFAIAASIAAAV